MAFNRSESDAVSKAPIPVTFGEKEYLIPVLGINKQRAWRDQLNKDLSEIINSFVKPNESNGVQEGLGLALTQFPERLTELVFSYAGSSLPREEVMEDASEEQISIAFSKIMAVAFPFLVPLAMVKQMARPTR